MNPFGRIGMAAALLTAAAGLARADDEIDGLVRKLKPPARFAAYKPQFSVRQAEYTFQYPSGPRTIRFFFVMDGRRHVAFLPVGSGVIHLLDFNPRMAPVEWEMPRDRGMIETSLGTKLRTDAFIPPEVGAKPEHYEFAVGDGTLTLVRRFRGTAEFQTWTHRSQGPETIDATNTFVFRCDPVFGYVVEGTYDDAVKPAPETYEYFSAATEGICNVWADESAVERAVITPTYREGYEGYYINLPVTDLCDNDRARFRCRDGGFAAFLNPTTGWSPATTIVGSTARFVVCNVHADLDFVTPWESAAQTPEGLSRRVIRTRILALPPEITRYLWDNMSLRFTDMRRVQIRVGRVEDFEDQPLPLTTWVRAMCSTGGGPAITDQVAHSGKKSAVIEGRFWPNLPQVPLKSDTRYRLSAWVKVVAWPDEKRQAAEEKERARIERLRARGQAVEPFKGFGPPEFYITGHLYQSSPHLNQWLVEQESNRVGPSDGWQKVELEFTTPKWAPFINVVFLAAGCTAYLDDFCLAEAGERR